jgi:quinohemoprotein ethanol dehydrogenase
MSYNPDTGLAYLPVIEMPGLFSDKHIDVQTWASPYWTFDPAVAFGDQFVPDDAGTGALRAWDPLRQQTVWEVPLPGVWNPGTLTTAGNLVFQGRADGKLVAYRADNGEVLWRTDLGTGISAPPVTYEVEGTQYVSLLVGWGGAGAATPGFVGAQHGWAYRAHPRRLVTFALDANVKLPPAPGPVHPQPIAAPDFQVDATLAERGAGLYVDWCMMCHGAGAGSAGYAPDLRASPIMLDRAALNDVVIGGSRRAQGMPNYPEFGEAELVALQHYVRKQANTPAPCKACRPPESTSRACAARASCPIIGPRDRVARRPRRFRRDEDRLLSPEPLPRAAGGFREAVQVGLVHPAVQPGGRRPQGGAELQLDLGRADLRGRIGFRRRVHQRAPPERLWLHGQPEHDGLGAGAGHARTRDGDHPAW